jgi:hypothetical protein
MPFIMPGIGKVILGQEVVRTGAYLGVPAEMMRVRDRMFDAPQGLVTDTAGLRIVHAGLYRAGGTSLADPEETITHTERFMESIQVPDEVTIQVNMHEVQVHVIWPAHDIAFPLHVLRQLSIATDELVEQVGGPVTADEARSAAPEKSGETG